VGAPVRRVLTGRVTTRRERAAASDDRAQDARDYAAAQELRDEQSRRRPFLGLG
jgi:hypothetical protein